MSRLSTKQRKAAQRRNIALAPVFDTAWAVEAWEELLASQREAPDYPYEGQSYYGTYAAEDARFDYWKELRDFYGDDFVDAVEIDVYGKTRYR